MKLGGLPSSSRIHGNMKNNEKIYVTKTFLPPLEEYMPYLEEIWKNNQLTNQGPLLNELEIKISEYIDVNVKNFQFVANGTLALQLALRALGITEGEIITTPFSYVATTSAILWERCEPVYVDIDPETLCIDPNKIEAAITKNTKAIVAVHVFGNPCDIEAIEKIAKKHNLKVIYDGAHAFGVTYKGKSLLSYGDISICSFHATKLFQTVEGGCLVFQDPDLSRQTDLLRRFGHYGDHHYRLGINAKASEFHAAMGLCNLKYIDEIIKKRGEKVSLYNKLLKGFERPVIKEDTVYNNSYYPVLFMDEKSLKHTVQELERENIFPRRYFYPSLNKLPYLTGNKQACPVSEDITKRVLCLPLYDSLSEKVIEKIASVLVNNAKQDIY